MNQHDSPVSADAASDPAFQLEVKRLHQLTIYSRWLVVGVLWLTIGALSLWELRYPISLLRDHFTWAAIRYGLAFNRWPAVGLGLCLGMTIAVLLRQSYYLLWGIPSKDQQRLEQHVWRIRKQGVSHPLWRWVCQR